MEINSHTKRLNLGIALKDAIEKPIQIDRYHFGLKCIIGIDVATKNSTANPRNIIKNADMAMYYAKKNPALNPMVYSDKISNEMHLSSSIEIALKKANLQEDLHVYFQPIFDLKIEKMICAEVFLYWKSEKFGLMEASKFMKEVNVNSDILNDICSLLVSKTIEYVDRWQKEKLLIPKISINVAQIQSKSEKFVSDFVSILRSHHINPELFEIEFGEEIWTNNSKTLNKIFSILKENNIDVCIDNFGSGYTSFIYIRKYGVKRIKIASEFVAQASNSKIDAQIVSAIIDLAKAMKIKVGAKGIEKEEDIHFLKELDCNEVQGLFLSSPMSAEEFEDLVRQDPQMIAKV